MRTKRTIFLALTLSGAIAGLAGMSEVAGVGTSFSATSRPIRYTAIIVPGLAG
jgi:ABC-type uncharacterized transport system permease subunit